jgi:hypothetical protein
MQSDGRELLQRAKDWGAGIKGQFKSVALQPVMQAVPPDDMTEAKWF